MDYSWQRRDVAVISDSGAGRDPLRGIDGFHVRDLTIAEGIAALDAGAAASLLVAEIAQGDDDAAALLERIDAHAATGGGPAVVICAPACIDLVCACISEPSVTLLCEPTAAERLAAVAFAMGSPGRVRETRAGEREGLQSLAEEVARIARALADLAGDTVRPGGEVFSDGLIGYRAEPAEETPASGKPVSAGEVRAMLRARRLRERFFPIDLFGEAAWDILLDLFAARIERTKVAVSSLCIAAAVPPTTALRAIRTMTERGLLARVSDPSDKRRVFIELSTDAAAAMQAYVAAARAL